MPVDRFELANAFALEPVELARVVVRENNNFETLAQYLDDKYTEQWRAPEWLWMQDKRIISLFKRDIFAGIKRVILRYDGRLYNLICLRFNWCLNRNNPTFELIAAIADTLMDFFAIPGVPALVAYLIKKKLLDELCECDR